MVVLIMQILPPVIALGVCVLFFVCAIFLPAVRTIFLIYGFVIAGHLFWALASGYISNGMSMPPFLAKTVTRFGLAGYLVLFVVWYFVQPTQHRFFSLGEGKATIRFPLVWRGIKERIWRFTLIFSLLCLGAILFFAFSNAEMNKQILTYGILFTLTNAILEELLWRGLILTRLLDITGEKTALIVSALAFGMYHYSLQFPIWTCLAFAIGGFYMGGSAIKSKGLLSPIIMHIMVNMVFVFGGIIF